MAHLSIDETHRGQGRKIENTDSKSPQRTHTPRLGRHPAALSSIEFYYVQEFFHRFQRYSRSTV
jgi:hypothetical protein